MYHARELAMDRMEEEAHQLGADGIVGVRLEVNHKEWGNHIAEFVAIGTAIVHRNDPHRYKNKHGRPFTSDLSGQDFYILLRSGYRPSGHGHGQLRVPYRRPSRSATSCGTSARTPS